MRRAVLAALLVLAAPAAHAAVSAADRSFLTHEARRGSYELAIAQLAARKATREDIKAYARQIISDHEQASAALQHLAQDKGVRLPTGMTNDEQTRFSDLQSLRGADFDRAYVKEAKRVNAEDKRDFAKEARRPATPTSAPTCSASPP